MFTFDITSLSSKGQIVIPSAIREALGIATGDKLLIVQENDAILLKPIHRPDTTEFKGIMEKGKKIAKELKLKKADIGKAIKKVRSEGRS